MSPFACLPPKSKLDTPVYMGNFLFLPRVHITTFVIFNMVPVGPGLGSNYGLRVIHILRALSLSLTSASGRRQSTLRTWTVHYQTEAYSLDANIAVKTSYLIGYKCDIVCA